MTDERDFDALAGEYVLGTLDHTERLAVERDRLHNPDLDAAVLAWERRLAPLDDVTAAVEPPADLYAAIRARIAASGAPIARGEEPLRQAEILTLKRRIRRWKVATVASGLIAASLAAVLVLKPQMRSPDESQFVAVLQKDSVSPAFIVSVDIATKQLTVRQVAADKLSGKSYELWLVNSTLPKPRSLGLLRDAGFTRGVTLANYSADLVENSVLAVSLEPEGGSPTGLPTGPVVFSGKLVQATP